MSDELTASGTADPAHLSRPRSPSERGADPLTEANRSFARRYPGESPARQPVHTVYLGAQHFHRGIARAHGEEAIRSLEGHAGTAEELARVLGLERGGRAEELHTRVLEKLRSEPVEDFRIDFEDGFGTHSDHVEDAAAERAAGEVAAAMEEGTLPRFIGLRLKSLAEETRHRALRTAEHFLTALLRSSGGRLPENLLLTLPKATGPEQVAHFVEALAELETRLELPEGALRFEVMVELPQLVMGPRGESPLPLLPDIAGERLVAAHFGTYDYTTALGITPAHQRMRHPACDHARHVMQTSFAGTGIWLSDGSTALLPVGDREAVHRAWCMHFEDVRHSLENAFYQGWDLHPAQLPTRFAAVYSFFLEGRNAAAERLRNFLEKASQATLLGASFDDVATGQALLGFFLRGIGCGAFAEGEVRASTGLTAAELEGRSFARVLEGRKG
jgi:citrate lyase beta subunit